MNVRFIMAWEVTDGTFTGWIFQFDAEVYRYMVEGIDMQFSEEAFPSYQDAYVACSTHVAKMTARLKEARRKAAEYEAKLYKDNPGLI